MKATWEKIEKNIGVLEVEVDAEQVSLALDKAFKKVAGKVNVPGFRKGKVPRSIFEAKFGIESLYRDAIDIILPDAYMEAVKETGIDPIDRPDIDFDEFSKGNTFVFKAKVMVKPEVQLGAYKGLEVPEQSAEVTAEEINSELESQQKRRAELIVVEEGTVENGDIAIIDYEGSVDGVLFDGGKADNHSLELGSNSFIPGFEEQVVGMSKEEVKDINVTFPEAYHSEDLAGKEAVFKVTLHEIKRKQLPELDDEFAKDVSEYETLEEYKQDIENKLKERKLKDNEITIESTVIEKAALSAEVEIPAVMVDTEVNRMVEEFGNRLRMQGMNMEMYFQFSGQNEDALREQMKDEAEKRVRSQLVLEAIANAENVIVDEEDLNGELTRLSEVYKKSADELRSIIESNGTIDDFKQDLRTKKTVKLLVESSKLITEVA
ncbi:MAG: trigger factor [Paenibacillaceae bacterium]